MCIYSHVPMCFTIKDGIKIIQMIIRLHKLINTLLHSTSPYITEFCFVVGVTEERKDNVDYNIAEWNGKKLQT